MSPALPATVSLADGAGTTARCGKEGEVLSRI